MDIFRCELKILFGTIFIPSMQTTQKKSNPNSIFLNTCLELGIKLTNNDESYNILNLDSRLFQIKLKNYLKNNDLNVTLEKFQRLLENYLDNELNFLISLLPTKMNFNSNSLTSSNSNTTCHSMNQDSFIKILAELDELQEFLFEYLLTKLTIYCDDEASNEKQILNLTINISTYILNQFRYQPKILNSEKLCEKFIELISLINSTKVKKELINCIPDIIGDSKHDKIANSLELLLNETDLISSTLETLKYFKFNDNKILLDIIEKLFLNYNLININDLPILIKFILKSIASLNSHEILNKLRKQIQFDDKDLNDNVKYLIYDVLKEYFQISNQLVNLYLDVLNNFLNLNNRLLSIDLLILFIIYTMPQNAKLVDKSIKNFIKLNIGFNENLIKKMFISSGKQIIHELFDTICLFNKTLILSTNIKLNLIASCVYKLCYEQLDRKYKQIVINLIVNHAISCISIERDNALDILYDLAIAEQTSGAAVVKLSQFAVIIKILLDFIDYFNLQQTRKLYFIMCTLAYDENQLKSSTATTMQTVASTSVIQDTLYIMITKQLSSNQTRYKQMGVMGVLMMLKCISNKISSNSTTAVLNNEIKNILQMVYDTSKNNPETICLFYDYLNSLIRTNSLIKSIEDILKDNLKDLVKLLFRVSDKDSSTQQQFPLQTQTNEILIKKFQFKIDFIFGLDNYTNGALNLHKQILNEAYNKNYQYLSSSATNHNEQQKISSPILIASLFRLISSLERKNLNELKSYLGIPVYCINELNELVGNGKTAVVNYEEYLMRFNNSYTDLEKKYYLDTIFYLINWFTEVINAFTLCSNHMNSEEINEKILLRLNLIIKLKEILLLYLPSMPFYKPPIAIFGLDESNEVPFIHTLLKKSKVNDVKKQGKNAGILKAKRKNNDNVDKGSKKKKTKSNDDTNMSNESQNDDNHSEDGDDDDDEDDTSIINSSISISETKLTKLTSKQIENENEFFSKLSICFREFDINLLNLLNLNLELSTADLSSISDSVINNIYIKPKQFLFILNDINTKLEFLLLKSSDRLADEQISSETATTATGGNSGLGFLQQKSTKMHLYKELNSIKATDLIDSLFMNNNLINSLFVHLSQIHDYLKQTQNKHDYILDSNSKAFILTKCFNQLFKLILILFKWFENNISESATNVKSLLKDFLFKLNKLSCNNDTSTITCTNSDSLVNTQPESSVDNFKNLFRYFSKFRTIISDLNTAQYLCELVDILFNKLFPFKTNDQLSKVQEMLAALCVEFLKTNFNNGTGNDSSSNKKLNNDSIYKLLKIFDKNCPSQKSFKFCEIIVNIIIDEKFMESRENYGSYPTLKLTFSSYYRFLLEYLIKCVKLLPGINEADARNSLNTIFNQIKLILKFYTDLVNLSKYRSFKEINLMNIFKNTKLFFDVFIKHAMPWLDQAFEISKDECIELIKLLQNCMLYLQDLSFKKAHLSKQIPQLMKLIESFQLRVKLMLYVNRCDNAFIASLHLGKLATNDEKKTKANKNKQVLKVKVNARNRNKSNNNDEDEDKENQDETSNDTRVDNEDSDDSGEENDDDNEEEDSGDE